MLWHRKVRSPEVVKTWDAGFTVAEGIEVPVVEEVLQTSCWLGTIADVEEWLETTPPAWKVALVRKCEVADKNRSGALAALDEVLD